MRRCLRFFVVACLLAIPAVAQRGGGGFHGGMGGFHGGGGFNGGGFHGGGFHGGMGGFNGRGFAGQGFRGGFVHGGPGGFHGGFGAGRRFVYGFSGYWPYYGAGWGYPSYSYPYYAYPSYGYSYSYPYTVYPYYSSSNEYGYASRESVQTSCPQANGESLYQIKLTYQNDVWLAQNYWYRAGTLTFITLSGEQKRTPQESIDRDLTFQLNNACGVHFELPR